MDKVQQLDFSESSVVEFKESWRDEYLKWITGFANSEAGGLLYIGVKDDGEIIGVKDCQKLLEDIPNKCRNLLGIVVQVNRLEAHGCTYLQIKVEHSSTPISFQGKFYRRSGATNQLLQGSSLADFLQAKISSWELQLVPEAAAEDLDAEAFRFFHQQAVKAGRESAEQAQLDRRIVLKSLSLMRGGLLTQAGVLLFHPHPEYFIMSAGIRIGFFNQHQELLFQDALSGPLLTVWKRAEELVFTKYLKRIVSFTGALRQETAPLSVRAFREALINALCNKDYRSTAEIQIKVTDSSLAIYNPGAFPEEIPAEKVMQGEHPSIPLNPLIARTFFRVGLVENWGTGVQTIISECGTYGYSTFTYKQAQEGVHALFSFTYPERQQNRSNYAGADPQLSALSAAQEHELGSQLSFDDFMKIFKLYAGLEPYKSILRGAVSHLEDNEQQAVPVISDADTDTETGDTDTKTGDADTKIGDADTKIGDTDTKIGDADTKIGDADTKTGDADTKTGDADTKTSDAEAKVPADSRSIEEQCAQILKILAAEPFCLRQELAERLKCSTATAARRLAKLQREGRITREGPPRGGRWKVLRLN